MNKRSKSTKHDRFYLTAEELWETIRQSQEAGRPTEGFCNNVRLVAEKMLTANSFANYPREQKEDMASAALLQAIKAIPKFKEERKDSCFSYLTAVIFNEFRKQLNKYYGQENLKKKMKEAYAHALEKFNPTLTTILMKNEEVADE